LVSAEAEELMRYLSVLIATASGVLLSPALTCAADLDPAALSFKLPDQISWSKPGGPTQTATLVGDPSKPGLYVQLVKWTPNNTSRPHFHPNDRFITVLSGTWWVGTGPKYDPATMVPMNAGAFVTHFGKGVHYDGAKDEPAVIQVIGMGPATATSAEGPGAPAIQRLERGALPQQ